MSDVHHHGPEDRVERSGLAGDILEEIEAEVASELEDHPEPGGPAYQIAGSLTALAVGVAGVVLALGYGLGSPRNPGPGLWPFVVSVLIVGLSLVLLVLGRNLKDSEIFTKASLLPLVGTVTFAGLAVLMPLIGFEIPSLILAAVWLKLLGGEGWRTTVIGSVLMVAAFYLLFIWGLRIPLPHLITF